LSVSGAKLREIMVETRREKLARHPMMLGVSTRSITAAAKALKAGAASIKRKKAAAVDR
jgi:hypothetical protein